MQGPVIAIDVSKGSSHMQGYSEFNVKLHKVKVITHNKSGFQEIIALKNELAQKTGKEVSVVFEATGVYHRPLEKFLTDNGIRHYVINPLIAAKVRKSSSLRSPKTDKLDPKIIAKVYYTKQLRINHKRSDKYHQMRELSRYYEDLMNHIRKDKVTFRAYLDMVFPGYGELFDDLYADGSLTILEKYPHPELLAKKHTKTVSKYVQNHTCHREKVSNYLAIKVIEFAKTVYSCCEKDDVEVELLRRQLMILKNHKKEADDILDRLIYLAQDIPNFAIIKSIPGIGDNLASRIIAELGDIDKYDRYQQIVAAAGIDPRVYQSGKKDGHHMKISKKGNKRLRTLLYLAVRGSIRWKDNKIKDYYKKKRQQSNPMNSKAAKIACATKLIRIIYSMCNTGTLYQYDL